MIILFSFLSTTAAVIENPNNPLYVDSTMTTTKRDIFAWALIALAAEPYVVSVLGTYMPILLEQLARENGVLASDHITPCTSLNTPPGVDPIPNPPPSNKLVNANNISNSCVLPILNHRFYIDTSSYALYTFSFSVLLQTVCVLTISGIADNSNLKKNLILIFGLLGGLTTTMFFLLGSHNYYAASILAILANCAFGCVNMLMNSYLTILIKNFSFHTPQENVQQQFVSGYDSTDVINEIDNFEDDILSIADSELGKVGSKISGIGTSTGYSSALLIQVCSLFLLLFLKTISDDMVWCIKIIIASIGVWWVFWQLPIAFLLRNLKTTKINFDKDISIITMVRKGYHDMGHALYKIKDLKDIYFFLLGWFVLSDSITTINSTAILFAKTNLHMPMVSLAKIGILVMISAIAGSIIIPNIIIGYFQWNLQHALTGLILWCLCVPIYGIVALNSEFEMYFLAVWYGIGLGGLSTISRSIYSIIIPKGKESVFFSIFGLTDKTSSIVGPFIIGLIINYFHELRGAFWVLALLLIISLPILVKEFNLRRARIEAENFS